MNPLLKNKLLLGGVAFLILAGTYVRLADLDTHFSHSDDLGVVKTTMIEKDLLATQNKGKPFALLNAVTGVPKRWTYAPLQYIFTYAMLPYARDPRTGIIYYKYNYRQFLFWGRFPSFVFGVLGLFALVWFYRRYDRLKTPAVLVALSLLAFSWENIIYAKQMSSYSIGVMSAVLLLALFWHMMKQRAPSLKEMMVCSLLLVVLSHTTYQMLFFMPAFFLGLFLYYYLRDKKCLNDLFSNFCLAGIGYVILMMPLYHFFLKPQKKTAGVHWNVGPHQEFQFIWDQARSLGENLVYTVTFFLKNTFIVFGADIGFIPEESPWFLPGAAFFAVLCLAGLVSLFRSRSSRKRMLGVFFATVFLVWGFLVVADKIALSPTRHSLILLPFFCVLIAEGWGALWRALKRFKPPANARRAATGLLLAGITVLYFSYYPQIVKERRDPFDQQELEDLLTQYHVDCISSTNYTWNISLMSNILAKFNYFESETMAYPYTPLANPPYQNIAFVSHRDPYSPTVFDLMKFKINLFHYMYTDKSNFIQGEWRDYKVVYSKELKSDTEIDFSKRTKNGSNSFYLTILSRV